MAKYRRVQLSRKEREKRFSGALNKRIKKLKIEKRVEVGARKEEYRHIYRRAYFYLPEP